MEANAIHRCPQCGDPTYLAGFPCDGCWFQAEDEGQSAGPARLTTAPIVAATTGEAEAA